MVNDSCNSMEWIKASVGLNWSTNYRFKYLKRYWLDNSLISYHKYFSCKIVWKITVSLKKNGGGENCGSCEALIDPNIINNVDTLTLAYLLSFIWFWSFKWIVKNNNKEANKIRTKQNKTKQTRTKQTNKQLNGKNSVLFPE